MYPHGDYFDGSGWLQGVKIDIAVYAGHVVLVGVVPVAEAHPLRR